ncbi:hypothetical protein GCM10027037_27340 [Mucilaginibacter koreensis]
MKNLALAVLLFFALPFLPCKAQITVTADSASVGRFNVIELTIHHPQTYPNNWEAVTINAVFSGPQNITVNGFYYDINTWKVRFAPPQTGKWNYAIEFKAPGGTYTATGNFDCITSSTKGYLRRHPTNPFRLVYEDGTLFNGLAFEDCISDFNQNGTPLDDFGFDGEKMNPPTYYGRLTDLKTYMDAYGNEGARFNLFRWTTDNCSFRTWNDINPNGNTYNLNEGKYGDTLVRSLRDHNIRIWLTFFGPPVFNNIDGSTPLEEAAIKRYINYMVARYGAYVDIWELFNEASASEYYLSVIPAYIRSIDPYKRLISVSDEQPKNPSIDIVAQHWYQREPELESDQVTFDRINPLKLFNKPILFGEQGNSVANWDPLSALRMRIRTWTSFFAEAVLVFWNTSASKSYEHPKSANIYLGPEERGYIRALHDFSALADADVKFALIKPINSYQVRGYGLRSNKVIMGYFHHYDTHDSQVTTSFKYRLFRPGKVYWINPADNSIISSADLPYGDQTITSPPFAVDIAMRIMVDNSPFAFNENDPLDAILYPNPADNVTYINGNFNGTAHIEMFDILGHKVFIQNNVANNQVLNLDLKSGVYIYRIETDHRKVTGRLIIR